MTNCKQRFQELTHVRDVILDEDLAALAKMSERARIERYNELKNNEETFLFEFTADCPDFFTDAEQARVRSQFRLARLLIAASFFDGGEVPRAMSDDFVEAELQAVVDFEQFKVFDALSEEQIQRRIRRMEGEVYELVQEYHSTQLANVDELLEDPDIHQDVMERLIGRYEDRFEKVRQGFYTFVETHGLEHMVETIEEAILAVAEAEREREAVGAELDETMTGAAETLDDGFEPDRRHLEERLREIERRLATGAASPGELQAELEDLRAQDRGISSSGDHVLAELLDRIDRTDELEDRLEERIGDLKEVRREAKESARESAREETAAVVEDELDALHEQREQVRQEMDRLRRERERVEAVRDRLEARQEDLQEEVESAREEIADRTDDLQEEVESVRKSLHSPPGGGEFVDATTARLYELDYVGRFDTSMANAETIVTPEEPFEVPDGYWDGRSEHWSERVPSAPQDQLLTDEEPEQLPLGQRARYEITSSRYLGLSREIEMVVEAVVHVNHDAYEQNGFDGTPAGLDDLLALVDRAIAETDADGHHYLLGVASPTGWTDRVLDQLAEEELSRSRFSPRVSVCVVDLSNGSITYDPSDEIASENADLFEFTVDAERVIDCKGVVREEYVDVPGEESVLLSAVAEDHGFPARVVAQAFDELEADGHGEQLYLEDLGTALVFSS